MPLFLRDFSPLDKGSFFANPILRQVQSLLQSAFTRECGLVLPLSISGILSLP